jgi:hypothetical protein
LEPDVREYPARRRKQQCSAPDSHEEMIARRVYVRGVDITEENRTHLLGYLNTAMQRRKLCRGRERAIVDANRRGSVLIFASSELATNALQLNGIDFCGSKLSFQRDHEYDVLVVPRKLYFSGCVITEKNKMKLIKYLTVVMRKEELCGDRERPIVDTDKCFLFFASAVMATRALQLSGIDFCGSLLTFERPHAYARLPGVAAWISEDMTSSDTHQSSSSDAPLGPSILATSNNDDKMDLRLYVTIKGEGVINADTSTDLLRFLNNEMRERGLCGEHQRPLVNVHFECIVCASAEMAILALQLNNVLYCGSRLLLQRSNEGECSLVLRRDSHIKVRMAFDFINKEMQKRNMCGQSEHSLTTYCNRTLMFTTATMASRAYSLNGIDCHGYILAFDRLSDYTGAPENLGTSVASTPPSWTLDTSSTQTFERPNESACRLYFRGVYPNEESKGSLLHFINDTMQERQLSSPNEFPLVDIDHRVLVFINSEVTTRALSLEGIEYDGCLLTFERTEKYIGPPDPGADEAIISRQMARILLVDGIQLGLECSLPFIQFLNETIGHKELCAPNECFIVDFEVNILPSSTEWVLFFQTPEKATHALNLLSGVVYNGYIPKFTRLDGYTAPANDVSTSEIEAEVKFQEPLPGDVPSKYGSNSADALNAQLMADLESALEEMKKDRDTKQKALERTQKLLGEATTAQMIAKFNKESLETVNKKWGEANAQAKVQEGKFVSATVEITQLKLKVERLERQEDSGALAKEQLRIEIGKLKQRNTQLEVTAKDKTKTSEQLRFKLETAEQRIQRMGGSLETVEKDEGKVPNTQVKEEEGNPISRNEESTQLKTKIEKLERQEHSRALVNEQLVLENGKLKQMNAQLEEADAKNETKATEEELRSMLETARERNQRMSEILANSMEELIIERKNLRELEAKMDTSLQSEKSERQRAEREVKDLRAALAAKSSVKHDQEWDV